MSFVKVTHVSRRPYRLPTKNPARYPFSIEVSTRIWLMFPANQFLATSHIRYLENVNEQLEKRLQIAEAEVNRLRSVNETLMINTAKRAAAVASNNTPSNLLQVATF
jgi:hypothetical protein